VNVTHSEPKAAPGGATIVLLFLVLCSIAFLLSGITWTGFLESDDLYYANAARGWLDDGLYLASSHWGLRHLIVLPIALAFKLLGVGEYSLLLPTVLYFVVLIGVSFVVFARWYGLAYGLVVAGALLSVPLLVATSTTVFADLPEAFWITASFYCFVAARNSTARSKMLIAAGLLAGAAWITRETTIAYLVFLALCFLVAPGMPRSSYFLIGAGFALVFCFDTLSLWIASGHPLYRYSVTMSGVQADDPRTANFEIAGGFDRHGNLATARWLQPLVMMFLQQKFGVLYFMAVPLLAWLCLSGRVPVQLRSTARLLAGLACTWFIMLSYVLSSLWIQNRYQTVTTVAAAIAVGLSVVALCRIGWRRLAVAVGAAMAVNAALMLSLENRDLLFGERLLVEWASEYPETITTDSKTRTTALFLLEAVGSVDRVQVGAPVTGALYFYNSAPRRGTPEDRVAPKESWTVVKSRRSPSRPMGMLLKKLGVLAHLPKGIAQKLAPAAKEAVLYRVR
jgi:4-amino-4-deoxy-L-arabinose transferase-like glycosyltransferase